MLIAFVLIVLVAIKDGDCLRSVDQNIRGATQSPISVHSHSAHGLKINDTDYWDNDDFVPYKDERHDKFDWRLLKTVLSKDVNNIIVSPFSVKLVLNLLYEAAGAETLTQRELSTVLPSLKSHVLIRELYKKILNSFTEENSNYDLRVGTKIFVDQHIEPRQRYAAIIHSHYKVDIEKLDFAKVSDVVSSINNWCKNISNGYIKDAVSQNDIQSAVMLIINTVYFNGQWEHRFVPNNTLDQPFLLNSAHQIKTSFMTQTNNFYFFDSNKLNAKIIRLPYKGKKFSMTIILPNENANLDNLVNEIDGDGLKRLQWLMQETVVRVSLPKFKYDYTSHLKDILQSMGITEIFSDSASLPGLARGSSLREQLKVSSIIQKSGIIVQETGTTSYSTTEILLTNRFGGNKVEEFNANRPFIFFIEDESTGTLLFAGKVMNPSVQQE